MKPRILLVGMVVVLMVGCGGGGNGLSGRWERHGGLEYFEFSGNRFTHTYDPVSRNVADTVTRGTYSISGDQIEFVIESVSGGGAGGLLGGRGRFGHSRAGDIVVQSFSRTEDTITIGRDQYNRAQ